MRQSLGPVRMGKLLVIAGALLGVGCSAEAVSEENLTEETPEVTRRDDALLGSINLQDSTCEEKYRDFAWRTLESARYIAVSDAYADCLDQTMRGATTLLRGGGESTMGPYDRNAADPFGGTSTSLSTQISKALYASISTNDVYATCDDAGGSVVASAQLGTYDESRQEDEKLTLKTGWMNYLDDVGDNGGMSLTADIYQASRQRAAKTLWHEVLHQWEYDHDASGRVHEKTVPYIAGSCMETAMFRSASCTNTCPAGSRPVMRWNTTSYATLSTCDCVADPEKDVGVMLSSGETCPTFTGRSGPRQLSIFMDDEDSGNGSDSKQSGWVGQSQVTTNGNTIVKFCAVPGRDFKPVRSTSSAQNYAVMRMGVHCPAGSVRFSHLLDNQDTGNDNYAVGHVPPHQVRSDSAGTYTVLEMCLFRASSEGSLAPFPSVGAQYGVFAGANLNAAISTGSIFVDNEDLSPSTSTRGDSDGSGTFLTITPSNNTQLRTARVR